MKVFSGNTSANPYSINFIDDAGVLVGFNTEQCCCENFNWSVYYIENGWDRLDLDEDFLELDDYFFVKAEEPVYTSGYVGCDVENLVTFRMVAEGKPELFLEICNSHNGDHPHAFIMNIDGQQVLGGGGQRLTRWLKR